MTFELSQSFTFDAAHTLNRNVPFAEYAPSRRVHGHTFRAEVTLRGPIGVDGMLQIRTPGKHIKFQSVDLFVLRSAIAKVHALLDHHLLDDVEGLGPATLENLCRFIAARVSETLPVYAVCVSRASGDKCRLVLERDLACKASQENSANKHFLAALTCAADGEGSEL